MSEKRFKLSSETVLQYQIMDNDTDLNESEVVDLLNYQDRLIEEQHDEIINWTKKYVGIKKENEQIKKARDESDKFIVKKGLEIEFLNWCVENE